MVFNYGERLVIKSPTLRNEAFYVRKYVCERFATLETAR